MYVLRFQSYASIPSTGIDARERLNRVWNCTECFGRGARCSLDGQVIYRAWWNLECRQGTIQYWP